jgi:hypothetical protein
MGEGGQRHASAALPPGKSRYLLYRKLGGPQRRSGQVRKISHPPGFDPRTVRGVYEEVKVLWGPRERRAIAKRVR